jgi:tRNA-specific 2-thiouridylase
MRILLGMSGGIDSTFAAKVLLSEGHTVEGAVVIMHQYTDILAAEQSCASLGIKLHVIHCEDSFKSIVINNFVSEYKMGRTPNPCVICNSEIKFSALYNFALKNGFDKIATGHYATVDKISDSLGVRYAIRNALDIKKDQTYVLWRLSQEILSKIIFPLYNYKKETIRKEAKASSLVAADREDSQENCFIPDNDYASFIVKHGVKCEEGDFIDESGNVIGRHKGIIHYTIGQRKGLGIALGKRAFVTDINPENNTVTLSDDKLYSRFYVFGMVFSGLREPEIGTEIKLLSKVRYLAKPTPAVMKYLGEGKAQVILDEPVRAVTPGQSCVFYADDLLLCGGFIDGKGRI